MNANKLADRIDITKHEKITKWSLLKASAMLRQQQAEIEALKVAKIRAYNNGVEDGRKPNTHPVKELTDEEIIEIGLLTTDPRFSHIESPLLLEFARAILRKAQEK